MCGGCGARSDVDWARPFLGSRSGRAAAAAVLAAGLDRPVDVRAAPAGWTLRRPTGAQLVIGTLSDLVAALAPRADAAVGLLPVTGAELPAPDRRRPVVLVHGEAAGAVRADSAGWGEQLMTGGGTPAVVATRRSPEATLHALLTDPLRRHVRISRLASPTVAGWSCSPGPLAGVPAVVLPEQLPALVALLALRVSGAPAGQRTLTRVAIGDSTLCVDALGPTVLAIGT